MQIEKELDKKASVSVESFPCLMLNEAGEVQVDVLLICKEDGMHTVQGTGEDKKVIFIDYDDIHSFIKTSQGFSLKINVDDGFMTLRYKTSDVDLVYSNVTEFAQRKINLVVVEDELQSMVGKVRTILEGTLKHLQHFSCRNNALSGNLFGRLPRGLVSLNLSGNRFDGQIVSFKRFRRLRIVWLAG